LYALVAGTLLLSNAWSWVLPWATSLRVSSARISSLETDAKDQVSFDLLVGCGYDFRIVCMLFHKKDFPAFGTANGMMKMTLGTGEMVLTSEAFSSSGFLSSSCAGGLAPS